jgi:hypothetical protein
LLRVGGYAICGLGERDLCRDEADGVHPRLTQNGRKI